MDESGSTRLNPEQDFVLKTVESRGVHFVRCWFSDVLGNMKSFAMVPGELEGAFARGMGFDGSCIEGFSRTQESDMLAFPLASTFQVLPWRPQTDAVARMFCRICTPAGTPFEGDPRQVLARMVERAADLGFMVNVGADIEFFYFKDAQGTEVLDRGSYFDLTSLDYASDLRRDTVLALEKMGIPVEYSHHEVAPSQHEIDLRYADAMSMADAVMTYKLVVREIALKHGVHASFMPKPMAEQPGNGMHVHLSLTNSEGENAFFDDSDPWGYCLSDTAKSFIAGILARARELCLVTNQYVNSYKRFCGVGHASSALVWARNNRSAMVRIPGYRPTSAEACRIEVCNPDPAANPYLAFAALLGAGLAGIEAGLVLSEPTEQIDMTDMSAQQLDAQGIRCLPETLGEAVDEFAASDLMRSVLGEHIHGYLVEAKRAEWAAYQQIVTPWELDRFLAVL
ncbi:glutamine synthetase family protein [Adlercreutzia murintestinalis]|uniref:glutamine synthetase family protein n=1 Tax=Adlercreutzia murintestinalis TaxID=2941325 RepID=UPI00203CFB9F|nr:glutamine synthetase family protein [Adlercreutzia murintestinalis]